MSERFVAIAPSILAADLSCLGDEVRAVAAAQADYIHFDVMDGHFVPNISFGPGLLKAVKRTTLLPLDVHLMIAPVDAYIKDFAEAGADIITVHPEAGPHLHRTLQLIKSYGVKVGVALNPATPLSAIEPVLMDIDLLLIMTVNPGFGGQQFIPSCVEKIEMARRLIDIIGKPISLEVDGGLNEQTSAIVRSAGADILVAGTAIFAAGRVGESDKRESDYAARIKTLRGAA